MGEDAVPPPPPPPVAVLCETLETPGVGGRRAQQQQQQQQHVQPQQQQRRVRFSALDRQRAAPYLALAGATGSLYFFALPGRSTAAATAAATAPPSARLLALVAPRDGPREPLVALCAHPDGRLLAGAAASGAIFVFSVAHAPPAPTRADVAVRVRHSPPLTSPVALVWDPGPPAALFWGDASGAVWALTVPADRPERARRELVARPDELWGGGAAAAAAPGGVVQLDFLPPRRLLVSTAAGTTLLDFAAPPHARVRHFGRKPRAGVFGACLLPARSLVVCARPGRRLWLADTASGAVTQTLNLSALLARNPDTPAAFARVEFLAQTGERGDGGAEHGGDSVILVHDDRAAAWLRVAPGRADVVAAFRPAGGIRQVRVVELADGSLALVVLAEDESQQQQQQQQQQTVGDETEGETTEEVPAAEPTPGETVPADADAAEGAEGAAPPTARRPHRAAKIPNILSPEEGRPIAPRRSRPAIPPSRGTPPSSNSAALPRAASSGASSGPARTLPSSADADADADPLAARFPHVRFQRTQSVVADSPHGTRSSPEPPDAPAVEVVTIRELTGRSRGSGAGAAGPAAGAAAPALDSPPGGGSGPPALPASSGPAAPAAASAASTCAPSPGAVSEAVPSLASMLSTAAAAAEDRRPPPPSGDIGADLAKFVGESARRVGHSTADLAKELSHVAASVTPADLAREFKKVGDTSVSEIRRVSDTITLSDFRRVGDTLKTQIPRGLKELSEKTQKFIEPKEKTAPPAGAAPAPAPAPTPAWAGGDARAAAHAAAPSAAAAPASATPSPPPSPPSPRSAALSFAAETKAMLKCASPPRVRAGLRRFEDVVARGAWDECGRPSDVHALVLAFFAAKTDIGEWLDDAEAVRFLAACGDVPAADPVRAFLARDERRLDALVRRALRADLPRCLAWALACRAPATHPGAEPDAAHLIALARTRRSPSFALAELPVALACLGRVAPPPQLQEQQELKPQPTDLLRAAVNACVDLFPDLQPSDFERVLADAGSPTVGLYSAPAAAALYFERLFAMHPRSRRTPQFVRRYLALVRDAELPVREQLVHSLVAAVHAGGGGGDGDGADVAVAALDVLLDAGAADAAFRLLPLVSPARAMEDGEHEEEEEEEESVAEARVFAWALRSGSTEVARALSARIRAPGRWAALLEEAALAAAAGAGAPPEATQAGGQVVDPEEESASSGRAAAAAAAAPFGADALALLCARSLGALGCLAVLERVPHVRDRALSPRVFAALREHGLREATLAGVTHEAHEVVDAYLWSRKPTQVPPSLAHFLGRQWGAGADGDGGDVGGGAGGFGGAGAAPFTGLSFAAAQTFEERLLHWGVEVELGAASLCPLCTLPLGEPVGNSAHIAVVACGHAFHQRCFQHHGACVLCARPSFAPLGEGDTPA